MGKGKFDNCCNVNPDFQVSQGTKATLRLNPREEGGVEAILQGLQGLPQSVTSKILLCPEKWANDVLLLGLSSSSVKKFNRNRSHKKMEAKLNVWAVLHDQEHQGKVPKAIMFVEDALTQDEVLKRAQRQRAGKRKATAPANHAHHLAASLTSQTGGFDSHQEVEYVPAVRCKHLMLPTPGHHPHHHAEEIRQTS